MPPLIRGQQCRIQKSKPVALRPQGKTEAPFAGIRKAVAPPGVASRPPAFGVLRYNMCETKNTPFLPYRRDGQCSSTAETSRPAGKSAIGAGFIGTREGLEQPVVLTRPSSFRYEAKKPWKCTALAHFQEAQKLPPASF